MTPLARRELYLTEIIFCDILYSVLRETKTGRKFTDRRQAMTKSILHVLDAGMLNTGLVVGGFSVCLSYKLVGDLEGASPAESFRFEYEIYYTPDRGMCQPHPHFLFLCKSVAARNVSCNTYLNILIGNN